MRIGVNLKQLRPNAIGGSEDYLRQVIQHITEIDDGVTFVLFCTDYNYESFTHRHGIELHRLSNLDYQHQSQAELRDYHLDLWFYPFMALKPYPAGLPAVVTIPDMQHEEFPDFFADSVLAWRRFNYFRSASEADKVITLSEYSKIQIVKYLAADPLKVHAIHLDGAPLDDHRAMGGDNACTILKKYDLTPGYLYYPANNWAHKNHRNLFRALSIIKRSVGSCPRLVLTGAFVDEGQDWTADLNRLGIIDDVKKLGFISRKEMAAIYRHSLALVFPSLYEGFGMPVIEAMRSDCPVLCSNATSLPEIGGDAVVYFDPTSPENIAEKILKLGRDDQIRQQMIKRGRRKAEQFSWRRTAEKTLSVFRTLVPNPTHPITISASTPPLISIVTPSYQQGRFVERNIESVFQGYPHIQHIVIDGGSTDGTLDILKANQKRHKGRFEYISEPDKGQAHAVNKGIARARGDIMGWLNPDDTYKPGALQLVADTFKRRAEATCIYGHADYIDEKDVVQCPYPTRYPLTRSTLARRCHICQPSVFFKRQLFDNGLRLDETLKICMDYDLWIRLSKKYPFYFLDAVLANFRIYRSNRTIGQRKAVFNEVFQLLERHYGYFPWNWVLRRTHFERYGTDQFFVMKPNTKIQYLDASLHFLRLNYKNKWFMERSIRRAAHIVRRRAPRSYTGVSRIIKIINLKAAIKKRLFISDDPKTVECSMNKPQNC